MADMRTIMGLDERPDGPSCGACWVGMAAVGNWRFGNEASDA